MTKIYEKTAEKLQLLFTQHFDITLSQFDWNKSLEELDVQFKVLGNLIFLEQLVEKEFGRKVLLLESISTSIHTPQDILELITEYLSKSSGPGNAL